MCRLIGGIEPFADTVWLSDRLAAKAKEEGVQMVGLEVRHVRPGRVGFGREGAD